MGRFGLSHSHSLLPSPFNIERNLCFPFSLFLQESPPPLLIFWLCLVGKYDSRGSSSHAAMLMAQRWHNPFALRGRGPQAVAAGGVWGISVAGAPQLGRVVSLRTPGSCRRSCSLLRDLLRSPPPALIIPIPSQGLCTLRPSEMPLFSRCTSNGFSPAGTATFWAHGLQGRHRPCHIDPGQRWKSWGVHSLSDTACCALCTLRVCLRCQVLYRGSSISGESPRSCGSFSVFC